MSLLVLKALLVPLCLLLVSLAGQRWGPAVAGTLGGFPVVAGPILLFLAIDQGTAFAAQAATGSLATVSALAAFGVGYCRAAQRWSLAVCLVVGLGAWILTASGLYLWVHTPAVALGTSLFALWLAQRELPAIKEKSAPLSTRKSELVARMLAGSALTLGVTSLAASLGPAGSGILAVFPVISLVLAGFLHYSAGTHVVIGFFHGNLRGLVSFCAFCVVLGEALSRVSIGLSFTLASLAAIGVQWGVQIGYRHSLHAKV